jgi:hypothetical protein
MAAVADIDVQANAAATTAAMVAATWLGSCLATGLASKAKA